MSRQDKQKILIPDLQTFDEIFKMRIDNCKKTCFIEPAIDATGQLLARVDIRCRGCNVHEIG